MKKTYKYYRRGKWLALALFLIGLAILTFSGGWWPGIMLVVGLPLSIWQYLQHRHYDTAITLFVFLGAFVTVQFQIKWQILLPVLFSIGGLYIFIREWAMSRTAKEEDEEEIKHDLED